MVDSNRSMMQYFPHASKVRIGIGNFSAVEGAQTNNYYTINERRRRVGENLPLLDQFKEIMLGDIIKDRDIGEPWLLSSRHERLDPVETALYTAKIINFGDTKFTVKAYTGGRKAKKTLKKKWRRDFLSCSNDWRRDIPLFGYNQSSIPLLIFHGDLIPIAHIDAQIPGDVVRLYFAMLRDVLGCSSLNQLWLNSATGRFCCGPVGPKCWDWVGTYNEITIPLDAEFLREDVFHQYFSGMKQDWEFLLVLGNSGHIEDFKDIPSMHYPQVISSSTNSTIAFIQNVRWMSAKDSLEREGEMSDGMTRFCLTDNQHHIHIVNADETCPWLSQALSVFHAHGISLDEDLSRYKLIRPLLKLTGSLQRSKLKQQQCQLYGKKPIYLFVKPFPSSNEPFYFWSHDPTGQNPFSLDMCKYMGLPFKLALKAGVRQRSWPTKIYKLLHDYQISRGFDPRTLDFAQHIGYPMFEAVPPESQFQEIEKESDPQTDPHYESEQSPLVLNNSPEHLEDANLPDPTDDKHPEEPDDFYSLDLLFYGIQVKGSAHNLNASCHMPGGFSPKLSRHSTHIHKKIVHFVQSQSRIRRFKRSTA
ncbi:hypothetical protein L218DRAFT_402293 [Marasmius fiardii PR-910]|nr:hypothetical protein L218DRAFT_402293 [Marasmius fiardii PR-910]